MEVHKYEIGVTGNCAFMAYTEKNSNICWMCLPGFDDSFAFGSLIGGEQGGEFSLKPVTDGFEVKQYYLENTNVLCTQFTGSQGAYRVIDFAPRFMQYGRVFKPLMLFRKIEWISGRPQIIARCQPVAEYGELKLKASIGSNHIRFHGAQLELRLTTDVSLNAIVDESPFVLSEDKYMVFSTDTSLEAELKETSEMFLGKTIAYWEDWVRATSIPGIRQVEMIRSALVLKLHQYEDTGCFIASGSMSLPEANGSGRNWDYRYCWIRDTYYTLSALNSIGHFEESVRYFQYIENILFSEENRIQPLYTIKGNRKIEELELDLPGYRNENRPVRLGNQAYTHIQNDVYGQLLVSLLPLYTDKRLAVRQHKRSIELVTFLLDRIEALMDEPDAGLWEFRNTQQKHCYTYLFHWAGSKAAIKVGKYWGIQALMDKGEQLAELAASGIEQCYSLDKMAYTQAVGNDHLDASTLKLISMGYLDPQSEKAALHMAAIEKELVNPSGLVYRYRHADDFGLPETSFLVCAFWYAEALACIGRLKDAENVLDKLSASSNHLGLFSEDAGEGGAQWGNFPQTYSHVGFMNTVFRIARKKDQPLFFD